MLNDLDRELEGRGHKFMRYADDCNIYVKAETAGARVMESVKQYLEKKLKLKVNPKKSKVERATRVKFLGFSFFKRKGEVLIRIADRTKERLMEKVRDLTQANPLRRTGRHCERDKSLPDRVDSLLATVSHTECV
jgi:hypothetical protein